MKNNVSICMMAMALSIGLRFLDGSNYHPNFFYLITSSINLVALFVVVNSILTQTQNNIRETYKHPFQSNQKDFNKCIELISYIIKLSMIVGSIIYLLNFRSSKGDDIISIIALFLSLCDSSLADSISALLKRQME